MAFDARPRRVPADELAADIARPAPDAGVFGAALPPPAAVEEDAAEAIVADALRAVVAEPETAMRPASVLFQDFQVRCRMGGLPKPPLDLPAFARRLACARAGIFDVAAEEWQGALALAETLPDDMMGAFLLVARAAKEGRPCPSDEVLAKTYGTASLGRIRRLLAYIEDRDLFVSRVDLSGKRSIAIPRLGWTTEPAEAA